VRGAPASSGVRAADSVASALVVVLATKVFQGLGSASAKSKACHRREVEARAGAFVVD